jgi:hypothetical protein
VVKKAGKKKARGKAVTTTKSKLPANWREQMRQDAAEEDDRVPVGAGSKITLNKRGQFVFQGADIGEEIKVIIVDHSFAKKYFDSPYDENNPSPPACFALKLKPDNIAPHDTSPDKQAKICDECWANKFKSDKRGKGKACQDKHRMAVLLIDDLADDSVLIEIEVPVTSGGAFRKYIKTLTKGTDNPSYAVVTTITADDDADWQKFIFTYDDDVPENLMGVVMARRKEARELVMTPYDVSGYVKPGRGGAKGGSKKKVAKKKKKRSRLS